jgi:outer membrane protein OmpA-like peptidoglycan-associated protein
MDRRTIKLMILAAAACCIGQGAFAQSAPSADDITNALAAPSKAGGASRGFRMNRDNTAAAPDTTPAPGTPKSYGTTSHREPTAPERREIGVPLLFDTDSATLKPESTPLLASIAKALQSPKLSGTKILIEGHTDASGGAAHNLALSQARAEAVKAALVQDGGVDASRLSVIGKGQTGLANPASPLAAENRRVVLVNLSPE